MILRLVLFSMIIIYLGSCDSSSVEPDSISIISTTINGSDLSGGPENVPLEAEITLVFSAALDPANLEKELIFQTVSDDAVDYDIAYSNAQSKITLSASLEYSTDYEVRINNQAIGKNGERLNTPYTASFKTIEDGTIYYKDPCTAIGDCLETKTLYIDNQPGNIDYYSSYPIYTENAVWEKLKYSIIVIHGQNRDADSYYSYLTSTLSSIGKQDSTVLLSPLFRESAEEPNDFYWSSTNGWREGQNSSSEIKMSSFAVVDSLIAQLNDKTKFPVLKKIIVTGHSSGGLFTHLYATSNTSESLYPDINFEFVIANSQYFYYPVDQRFDENTESFYEPSGCAGYNFWPLGFINAPSYIQPLTNNEFNTRFINRKIIYLLGNGSGSDGSLNTASCDATLLGSSRYLRGENIFRVMNTFYAGEHAHERVIVNGVGHDGENMYKSSEFRTLITDNLE